MSSNPFGKPRKFTVRQEEIRKILKRKPLSKEAVWVELRKKYPAVHQDTVERDLADLHYRKQIIHRNNKAELA